MSLDITRVIRIVSLGVERLALVITLIFGGGPIDQHAAAGKLMIVSSPMGARVSSAMQRHRWTAGPLVIFLQQQCTDRFASRCRPPGSRFRTGKQRTDHEPPRG